MQTFTITFQAGWSNRKVPQMERDLLVMISREGAKHVRFHREGEPPPEERPALNLACTECEKKSNGVPVGFWTAEFFSECPTCNVRDFVRKVPQGEVDTRDALIAIAAQEIAEAAEKKEFSERIKEVEMSVAKAVAPKRRKPRHKHSYKKDRTCRNCGRKKPGRSLNG